MKFTQTKIIISLVGLLLGAVGSADARDYIQLRGVIHVHSNFSSGRYSIEALVNKAREAGLEVLILTDHDQVVMEYGLFPFRNLIKKGRSENRFYRSVLRSTSLKLRG